MRPSSPQAVLAQADTQAFLITNLLNIRYLTGLSLTAGLVLVTSRRFILYVDARYREEAERSVRKGMDVRDVNDLETLLKNIPECGYESDEVTIDRLALWKKKFKNTKFIQKRGVIEEFRRRKDDDELKLLRRAERMTRELLRRVPSVLRTTVTEEKLARQLTIWALDMGADGLSFDPIVAFGTHTSRPHHRPTARSLKKGHIVQIDVGVKYRGYCADLSDVFFTARPTAQQMTVYETLLKAKRLASKAVAPGVTNRSLDLIARDVLRAAGIDHAFTHSLGHGVGLDVHEGVTLSSKAPDMKLLKNEVITIEPGVYFEGKFGMRLEDMIVVR